MGANTVSAVRPTPLGLTSKVTALEEMDGARLRIEWRQHYRSNPPGRISRDLLILAIAWKLQEKAFGDLTSATKRKLANLGDQLVADGDLATQRTTRLKPGVKLVREWHGETHIVVVVEEGFEWRGKNL